ncbi:hypothetical protein BH18THE1_BH18THE1_12300 [soil metagenome]
MYPTPHKISKLTVRFHSVSILNGEHNKRKLISRNAKKDPIIDKFRMGERYCNDPRCQRNRNGERHKSHLTNENQASIFVGENYCNDPRCRRNRNGERHEAHIERINSKDTTVEKLSATTKGDTYSYCNDPRCQTNRNGERHKPHSPDNPDSYHNKYKGRHKEYPSPTATRMHFYEDRIEVDYLELVIPYRFMKNIENIQEKRISALRVVVLA